MKRFYVFLRKSRYTLAAMLMLSCGNHPLLSERPRTDLLVPSTLKDLQALLDLNGVINSTPALGEVSADNYFIEHNHWQTLPVIDRNAYIWADDVFQGQRVSDWNTPYEQILYANIVLEALQNISITAANRMEWDNIKGSAHFVRGHAFFQLAQIFAPPFDSQNPNEGLGIPIRLTPDINEPSVRYTLSETYRQILHDLEVAQSFLRYDFLQEYRNRPSKSSNYAMLARVCLSIRDYELAQRYADSCLSIYSTLIDYNTLSQTSLLPFSLYNEEMLISTTLDQNSQTIGMLRTKSIIDSTLISSYHADDLRKVIFFRTVSGKPVLKGGYNRTTFSGVATDEVYLIRAESRARMGDKVGAIADINTLLRNRFTTGSYVDLTPDGLSEREVLELVLVERRKELCFRGLRWSDIRRLNLEGYNIVLKRAFGDQVFNLEPNSPKYTLPIPPEEIPLSQLPQNLYNASL